MLHAYKTRYIPPESIPYTRPDAPGAIAYLWTASNSGLPAAIGYTAGAVYRPAFKYSFRSTVERQLYVDKWLNNLAANEARKATDRQENKTWRHDWQVGDILSGSWGYDQTNAEFYQVVEVSPTSNSVMVRKISMQAVPNTAGFMSESVTPLKDGFIGPARRALVKKGYRDVASIHITVECRGQWDKSGTRVSLDKWDGKPCYSSWYA
jgi:hypothetical protein